MKTLKATTYVIYVVLSTILSNVDNVIFGTMNLRINFRRRCCKFRHAVRNAPSAARRSLTLGISVKARSLAPSVVGIGCVPIQVPNGTAEHAFVTLLYLYKRTLPEKVFRGKLHERCNYVLV